MADLSSLAKVIILVGLLVTATGILFLFSEKMPWFGRLPGDIYIQKENFNFYFPITTCVIISVLLSIILYFLTKR